MPAPVDAISKLPVVRVGDKPPQEAEYVVFFPAGTAFPVKIKASGSMFASEGQFESRVALAKDLYLYKYWASHDGKSWVPSHAMLNVEFGGGLDISGLNASLKLEARN
jgi:hypothetical protein